MRFAMVLTGLFLIVSVAEAQVLRRRNRGCESAACAAAKAAPVGDSFDRDWPPMPAPRVAAALAVNPKEAGTEKPAAQAKPAAARSLTLSIQSSRRVDRTPLRSLLGKLFSGDRERSLVVTRKR